MPSPIEKMIRHTTIRTPSPRLRAIPIPSIVLRRRIIDIKYPIRFLREPLRPVPGHVLQDELGADVVDEQVVVAGVDVDGDVVSCG